MDELNEQEAVYDILRVDKTISCLTVEKTIQEFAKLDYIFSFF
ncbi:MAG: hypothetical protein PHP26_11125 [Syntrophomonas sp.]|nr:hypothetical protein [Syntrophomonas sp.]